jgi:hypothetical protein
MTQFLTLTTLWDATPVAFPLRRHNPAEDHVGKVPTGAYRGGIFQLPYQALSGAPSQLFVDVKHDAPIGLVKLHGAVHDIA